MPSESQGLKRELKLRDLVLMQVLLVVALNFTGYAAKQGASQVVLWVIALALFYVPLAFVVMKLSRMIPLEGGVYQWVKQGISPFAGYMAGWSFAVWGICSVGTFGSQLAEGFGNAGGSNWAWMGTSKAFALLLILLLSALALGMNLGGLHLTRWVSGGAGLLTIGVFAMLLWLLGKAWMSAKPLAPVAFSIALPGFSLLTVNVFSKMTLFALSGFEQCAIFTEECRKPKNDVARSVVIAAPLIAVIYIGTTCTLLAYLRPANVDLAAPLAQAFRAGFGDSGVGRILTLIAVGAFSATFVASGIVLVGMLSRLPMVAGWDGVLPGWWSELRRGSPAKAIAAVAGGVAVMGAASLFGAHNQEAVQALSAVACGSYCIMYLLLFGTVVFGFRATEWRPGMAVRAAALVAFCAVLPCLGLQLVPIGEVPSPMVFGLKVIVAILLANGLGAFLYWRGMLRKKRLAMNC